jgi:uncharacterized RDD family membrane protein YckC
VKKRARARSTARGAALIAELGQLARDPLLPISLAVVALTFLDDYVWVGALLRELAFPIALIALALAIFFLFHRRLARGLLLLLCGALLARGTFAYLRAGRPTPQHGPTLRIAHAHAQGARVTASEVARLLAASSLDVLSLTGLKGADTRRLAALQNDHRAVVDPQNAGQLLWVRRALSMPARNGAHALVRVGRCQLALVQVDLPSLFAPSMLSARRRRISQLAQVTKDARRVYVGHFGSGSDSADLAPFHAHQELRDARLGHGRQATAPDLLGPIFGLPVDHVLLHGWLLARSVASEPPLVPGAHRTLHATLELTEPRCAPREPARPLH